MKHTAKLFICLSLLMAVYTPPATAAVTQSIFRTHTNYSSRIFRGPNALTTCRDASADVRRSFSKPSVIAAELTLIEAGCVIIGEDRIQLVITHEHPYAESLSTFRLRFTSNRFCNDALPALNSRLESSAMPPVYSYCEEGTANIVLADPVSRVLTTVDSWSRHETYSACLQSAQITAERLLSINVQPVWTDCVRRSEGGTTPSLYPSIAAVFPAGLSVHHLTGNLFTQLEMCLESTRDLEQTLLHSGLTPTSSFCYQDGSMYREKVSYVTSVRNQMNTTSGGPFVTATDCHQARASMVTSLEGRRRRVVYSYCEPGATFSYQIHTLPNRPLATLAE